jgi:hypothetical protein
MSVFTNTYNRKREGFWEQELILQSNWRQTSQADKVTEEESGGADGEPRDIGERYCKDDGG